MYQALTDVVARLLGRPSCARVSNALFRCSMAGLGVLNYRPGLSGEHQFLKEVLTGGGGVLFDVGANSGDYARAAYRINPALEIYAFEPHPFTYAALQAALGQEFHLHLINKGVSAASGTVYLHDYASNDGSQHATLYREVIADLHGVTDVKSHLVDVTTVDDFMRQHDIPHVRLLKVDVEGHEYDVLEGARVAIESRRIGAIHFEFNEMNIFSRRFFKDFWDLLAGYDFYRLLPRGRLPIKTYQPLKCELFAYQNIVAILRPRS